MHRIRSQVVLAAWISGMILIGEKDILFTCFFLQSPEMGYTPNFLDNIGRWHVANNVELLCDVVRGKDIDASWKMGGGGDRLHPLVAYMVIV